MNHFERDQRLAEIEEAQAALLLDMARRHAQPEPSPKIAMAPRPPAPPAPRPAPPATPRQPAPTRLDRHALEAIGRAIATVRAEIEAKHQAELAALIRRADDHQAELHRLAERIEKLEQPSDGRRRSST